MSDKPFIKVRFSIDLVGELIPYGLPEERRAAIEYSMDSLKMLLNQSFYNVDFKHFGCEELSPDANLISKNEMITNELKEFKLKIMKFLEHEKNYVIPDEPYRGEEVIPDIEKEFDDCLKRITSIMY